MKEIPFYIPHELIPLLKDYIAAAFSAVVVGPIMTVIFVTPLFFAFVITLIIALKYMRQTKWKRRVIYCTLLTIALYPLLFLSFGHATKAIINHYIDKKEITAEKQE